MAIEDKLKIGEMPEPRYLCEMGNTSVESDGSSIKWIGMRAYGLDKQIRDFLWWRNFKAGNLNNEAVRYHTAAFIARLYMETEAEAAIGLPIDLYASSQSKNYVAIPKDKGIYGVYVQADKRQMFNFMTMMNGIGSEAELRRKKPVEFDRIFQQARAVLPYHRK
jgi:hypothetical protein